MSSNCLHVTIIPLNRSVCVPVCNLVPYLNSAINHNIKLLLKEPENNLKLNLMWYAHIYSEHYIEAAACSTKPMIVYKLHCKTDARNWCKLLTTMPCNGLHRYNVTVWNIACIHAICYASWLSEVMLNSIGKTDNAGDTHEQHQWRQSTWWTFDHHQRWQSDTSWEVDGRPSCCKCLDCDQRRRLPPCHSSYQPSQETRVACKYREHIIRVSILANRPTASIM